MKTHARHITAAGLVAPIALALATAIANEAQTLLGLHLDNIALSLYMTPFLLAAGAIIYGLAKLEAAKLFGSAGEDLITSVLGGLFGPESPPSAGAPPLESPPEVLPPPPPPPPPSP